MTLKDALWRLKAERDTYKHDTVSVWAKTLDMAIKAVETWVAFFESYEELTDDITETKDFLNATERIDKWCIDQLRGIIGDYYAEKIISEHQEPSKFDGNVIEEYDSIRNEELTQSLQQAAERICEARDKWFEDQERKEHELTRHCDILNMDCNQVIDCNHCNIQLAYDMGKGTNEKSCDTCDHYKPINDGIGTCNIGGCYNKENWTPREDSIHEVHATNTNVSNDESKCSADTSKEGNDRKHKIEFRKDT